MSLEPQRMPAVSPVFAWLEIAGRLEALGDGALAAAITGWRDELTRLVVRLSAEGVGSQDEVLKWAWQERSRRDQAVPQEAIAQYRL